MTTKTSAAAIQKLADETTAEGLRFVRARKIVDALWKNGEEYHAGAIEYKAWGARNRKLWDAAEKSGLSDEVKRQLRTSR